MIPAARQVRVCSGKSGAFIAQGSDALVYFLAKALPDKQLRYIAKFNTHIPTSVFIIDNGDGIPLSIRWFNPSHEIKRCGHGTLAAAAVIAERNGANSISFISAIGESWPISITDRHLSVQMQTDVLLKANRKEISSLLPVESVEYFWQTEMEEGYAVVCLYQDVDLKSLRPKLDNIACIARRALVILQKKDMRTLAFRYFAPQYGVPEDQATLSSASVIATAARAMKMPSHIVLQQYSAQGALMYLSQKDQQVVVGACADIIKNLN